jgi:hypothetical protein
MLWKMIVILNFLNKFWNLRISMKKQLKVKNFTSQIVYYKFEDDLFVICDRKNVSFKKYGEIFLRNLRFRHIINYFTTLLATIF